MSPAPASRATLPSGQLLFVRGGRLYSVGFDAERLTVQGSPEVILDTVRYNPRNGGCHLDVSASGVLAYTPGVPSSPEHYLAWFNRDGTAQRAVDTPRLFRDPRVSPDGRRIAAVVGSSTESDLWMLDANSTLSRLSFGMTPHRPAWTPDGTRITVGAAAAWSLATAHACRGRRPAHPSELFQSPNRLYPDAWSPDGKTARVPGEPARHRLGSRASSMSMRRASRRARRRRFGAVAVS